MKQHKLKTEPEYFEAQRYGLKSFEIRKNDRDFKVGDVLILVKFEDGVECDCCLLREVTYVTDFPRGLKKGYICMATKPRGIMI